MDRPSCSVPGCERPRESKGINRTTGRRTYNRFCTHHKNHGAAVKKESTCVRCGFVAENPCQIDIDHIDGNRLNNHKSNLQSLCANCHRLKTIECQDWLGAKRSVRPESYPLFGEGDAVHIQRTSANTQSYE